MKKRTLQQVATVILSMLLLLASMTVMMIVRAQAAPPADIVDELDDISGANRICTDAYGVAVQQGDVGFGADTRYVQNFASQPTSPANDDTIWSRAYFDYAKTEHNLLEVWVDAPPDKVDILPKPKVFAGAFIEANNIEKQTSSNWTRIKYTYILNSEQNTGNYVRVFYTIYNGDTLESWMQQITKIRFSYAQELPKPDSNYYVDKMENNQIIGQRSDVYNVDVLNTNVSVVGDTARIVFGSTPAAAESYIDYSLSGKDRVKVTYYEEINEDGTRPEITKPIAFSLLGATWEDEPTKVEVELGSYAFPARYTRVTALYEVSAENKNRNLRIHFYNHANKIQVGRVELFESSGEQQQEIKASGNVAVSGWISIPEIGQASYLTDTVDFENAIFKMTNSGINTFMPDIWKGDTLEYRHRLLNAALKVGAKAYVYDASLIEELSKTNGYNSTAAAEKVETYKDHPAFKGHFIMDEPSLAQLSDLENASARYKDLLPGKVFYVNLLPNHAVSNYDEYLNTYFTKLKQDYVSFDHYVLTGKEDSYGLKTGYLKNLDEVAKKAKAQNAALKTIINATGHYNSSDQVYLRRPTSIADVSFAANASLAYGTKSITWFTYGAMNDDAQHGEQYGMLNKAGEKTEVYEFVKTANENIAFMSAAYAKYAWQGTLLKEGSQGEQNESFAAVTQPLSAIPQLTQFTSSQDVIAGYFDNGGEKALMLTNYTDPSLGLSSQMTLTFDKAYLLRTYKNGIKTDIALSATKQTEISLAPGEGIFIEMSELELLKSEAKAALDEKVETAGESNYSVANWSKITKVVTDAKAAIDSAENAEEVEAVLAKANADIDKVETLAATALKEAKANAKTQLDTFVTSKGEANYSVVNWAKISALKTAAIPLIDGAESAQAVTTVVNDVKSKIDAVMTLEQEQDAALDAPFYVDDCIGNIVDGQRADLYNLAVSTFGSGKVGDDTRVIFGTNPGATESYIEYTLQYQDTVKIVGYEKPVAQTSSDFTRPNTSDFKISYWAEDGSIIAWEEALAAPEITKGNEASGRWTKLVYTKKFDTANCYKIRVHIYNGANGETNEDLQLGKVYLYNSLSTNEDQVMGKLKLENEMFYMDSLLYNETGWAKLTEQYEKGLAAITAAENQAEINSAIDAAITAMKAVPNKDAEFLAIKQTKKAELEAYVTAKGESNYSAENWQKILQALSGGKAAIEAADTETKLNTAFLEARDSIDAIQIISTGGGNANSEDKPKKGCFAQFNATGLGVVVLLIICAGTLLIRRKDSQL